jgi:hypothetical protein
MIYRRRIVSVFAAVGLLSLSSLVGAQEQSCDRACLKGLADRLLQAFVGHDDSGLPLSQVYASTENSVGLSPNSMTIFRTATAVKDRFYIVDPVTHQLYMVVTMAEGSQDALLFGRIKAEGRSMSEIELFESRSRGQDGLTFKSGGPTALPVEWTQSIPASRLPSRAELLKAGESMFNTFLSPPPSSPDCVLFEEGKIVAEDQSLLKSISDKDSSPKKGKAYIVNPDGTVPVPCGGGSPHRPPYFNAKTDILDEDQGIVISRATLHGETVPYIITKPTESVYVPYELLPPFVEHLGEQRASGKYTLPSIRPMSVTSITSHIFRIYDGKIQGMMLLFNLAPPGAHSPWDE